MNIISSPVGYIFLFVCDSEQEDQARYFSVSYQTDNKNQIEINYGYRWKKDFSVAAWTMYQYFLSKDEMSEALSSLLLSNTSLF